MPSVHEATQIGSCGIDEILHYRMDIHDDLVDVFASNRGHDALMKQSRIDTVILVQIRAVLLR